MFNQILYRLQHVLMVATLVGLALLAWVFSPPAGVAGVMVVTLVLVWLHRRGFFKVPASAQPRAQQQTDMEAAKTVVTQMLASLTRVQVAYLCQQFEDRKEARRWLRRALPRAFQNSLDELLANLENARMGSDVPAVHLAERIVAHKEQVAALRRALAAAAEAHPERTVAEPILFVVTEALSAQGESEPELLLLAGWNPALPSLLPETDALTVYSELEEGKKVRGKADFSRVKGALGDGLRPISGEATVYLADPVADPGRLGFRLEPLPMGFTVSAADLAC